MATKKKAVRPARRGRGLGRNKAGCKLGGPGRGLGGGRGQGLGRKG